MIVDIRTTDKPPITKALVLYEKLLDAAIKASEKVHAPTLWLDCEKARVEACAAWLIKALADAEPDEAREVDLPESLSPTFLAACIVYEEKLAKTAEGQIDLLVTPNDTQHRLEEVRRLAKRLLGQTEFPFIETDATAMPRASGGSIAVPEGVEATVSINGGPAMPFTTAAERAAAAGTIAEAFRQ